MKRTTIFADESLLDALQEIARKERVSLSATIRTALEEFAGRRFARGTLPSFLGIGRSGRKDIAEHAKELLGAPLPLGVKGEADPGRYRATLRQGGPRWYERVSTLLNSARLQ